MPEGISLCPEERLSFCFLLSWYRNFLDTQDSINVIFDEPGVFQVLPQGISDLDWEE
jgi:hypothetical protein